MTYLKKPLRKSKFVFAFAFAGLLIIACSEENVPKGVVAKVGNEKLTVAELESALKKDSTLYRQEYIRNWIATRTLLAEAKEQKITETARFKRIVGDDKARIAGALLIQQYLRKNEPTVEPEEEKEYFDKNKDEFRLTENAFLFNRADFSTEIDARNFRYIAQVKNWDEAVAFSKKSNGLIGIGKNIFAKYSEIYPSVVKRLLANLDSNEVSVVFRTERNKFTVVQCLKKFGKNQIPDFKFVEKEIHERLLIIKRKAIVKEYENSLYSKYNAEIYR